MTAEKAAIVTAWSMGRRSGGNASWPALLTGTSETCFMNVVRPVRLVAPAMQQQGGGSIVNISTDHLRGR